MSKLHLTDLTVLRLHTPGTYLDDTLPGFGIRIGKNRKTWIVMRGQIRQRLRIGHYPAMSLAAARKEAKRLLLEKPTRDATITFEKAFEGYKESIAIRKPRTQAEYKRLICKHFIPKVGKKRLTELLYEDLMACVKGLRPGEAAHALAICRAFLRWCVKPPRRYILHSPLEGVEVAKPTKRKRILNDEELKIVWHAAEHASYPYGTLCQLLAATGQRRNEIANLRRLWIDERERTITFPVWLTKNSKEHVFPYGDLVAGILDKIPRRNDTDLLFPSRVSLERPLSGWSKYKRKLGDGIRERWTLHDLRRTYRSLHGKIGTLSEIAERLVNHVSARTEMEETYDLWTYLPQMRDAVSAFEEHLKALLARR